MKKFMCTLFTLVIMIPMCAVMSSAKTATYKSEFPDSNFRKHILYLVGNPKESAKIDTAKLAEIKALSVRDASIKSMDGIKYLTGLTSLDCSDNKLKKLDLSNNKKLVSLKCHSQHISIPILYFTYVQSYTLTSLNISQNTALTELDCGDNKLAKLDISKNTALIELHCSANKLTSLDLSKNTALTILYCSNNKLTKLDLSKNTALTELQCYGNKLTSLDLSKNTALKYIYASSKTNINGRRVGSKLVYSGSIFTDHAGVFIGVGALIVVGGIAAFVVIRKKKKSSQGIEQ